MIAFSASFPECGKTYQTKHHKNMDEFVQKDGPHQKELLFSGPNDLVVQEIELEESSQSASASNALATYSIISSDVSLTSEDGNPWPYITKYFQFKGFQGDNVLFVCVQCLPAHKVISTSRRSRNNLKKHLRIKHTCSLREFETCITEGSWATKIRRRQASLCGSDRKQQKDEPQLAVLDATTGPAGQKVISVGKLIDVFVEDVLPLDNNPANGSITSSDTSLANSSIVSSDMPLANSSIVSSDMPLANGSITSSDTPQSNGSIVSSDTPLPPEEENPWPYITKYFQFKGYEGDHILFECVQCLPAHKVLSTCRSSRTNLKKHVQVRHNRSLREFETCITEGSRANKMKRRHTAWHVGDKKQHSRHQLALLDAMADSPTGKDSHTTFEEDTLMDVLVGNVSPQHSSAAATSSLVNDTALALENGNPWPYITKYFQFKGHGGDNVFFECVQCLPTHKVISTSRKSRNNLRKHLRIKHTQSLKEFDACFLEGSSAHKMKKRQVVHHDGDRKKPKLRHQLALLDSTTEPVRGNAVSQATLENRLINVLVENMLPLHVLESDSFKALLQLVPGKHCVSAKSLTRVIEARFENEKERLKGILHELPAVATTANAWTCRNRSYLSMTVHWINPPTFKRMKAFLACQCLRGQHPSDIVKAVQEIHRTFGIENKVTWITTDNAIKAFSDLGQQDSEDGHKDEDSEATVQVESVADLLEEQAGDEPSHEPHHLPKHSRCAAQTLNLVATTDAAKALDKCAAYKQASECAFAKTKELWSKWHRSSEACDAILEHVGKLLLVPSVTRWNSVYTGVKHLVEIFDNKDSLRDLQNACNSLNIPHFTDGDTTFLQEYQQVMEPVAKAQEVLQQEEWAYMGTLLPTLAICLKTLKEYNNSPSVSVCRPLLQALVDGLTNRFSHLFDDMEYLLATALNPKFKLTSWPEWLIDDTLSVEEMKKRVTNRLASLLEEASNKEHMESGSEIEGEESREDRVKGEDYFQALYNTEKRGKMTEYLARSFLEDRPAKDINIYVFPSEVLLNLFIKFNTPIPSCAAVECLFSVGKDVLLPEQVGLGNDHFEMFVFLIGNKQYINRKVVNMTEEWYACE